MQHWTVPNEKLESDDGWQVRADARALWLELFWKTMTCVERAQPKDWYLVQLVPNLQERATCSQPKWERVWEFFSFSRAMGQKHSEFCAKISEDSFLVRHGTRTNQRTIICKWIGGVLYYFIADFPSRNLSSTTRGHTKNRKVMACNVLRTVEELLLWIIYYG